MNILPLELSTVKSRKDCDTSFMGFDIPCMLAPMAFFTHEAIELINNRFLYILPRINPFEKKDYNYQDINYRIEIADKYSANYNIGAAIGLTDKLDDVKKLASKVKYICLDVASGYSIYAMSYLKELKMALPDTIFISGNVGNKVGYEFNISSGANYVRFGIGTGGNCTTSVQTPVGSNNFESLLAMYEELKELHGENHYAEGLIYDGGIKTGSDFSFALLYADWVMCSSVFAGTQLNIHRTDPERDKYDIQARTKVLSYGMASSFVKSTGDFIEGKEVYREKEDFETIYKTLKQSLQSTMSYLNSHNMNDYKNAQFEITKF